MEATARVLPYRVGSLLLGIGVFSIWPELATLRGIVTHISGERVSIFLDNGRYGSYNVHALDLWISGKDLTVEVF